MPVANTLLSYSQQRPIDILPRSLKCKLNAQQLYVARCPLPHNCLTTT